MITFRPQGVVLALALAVVTAAAAPIAGVDFENGSGGFSRTPDDLDTNDLIAVSSDWTLPDGDGFPVGLGNDLGANADQAFEGDYVGRLQQSSPTGGSWSISIPDTVTLSLTNVTFAVRGATGGSGRAVQFRTSLDTDWLYANLNLPGRDTTPNWVGATAVDIELTNATHKSLTDATVAFVWATPGGGIDIDGIVVSGVVTVIPQGSVLLIR